MAKRNEEIVEAQIILFDAEESNDIRLDYPELANIPEFKELRNKKEVRICWLIGSPTSPIKKLEKKQRVKRALEIVYGSSAINRTSELKEMYEMKDGINSIPVRMSSAIERMTWFDPENRLRAKLLSQYMFDTLSDMIVMDENAIRVMDMDERKKYADLLIKVNSELPQMVKTLESGYGVKVINRKTKKEVLVNINTIQK